MYDETIALTPRHTVPATTICFGFNFHFNYIWYIYLDREGIVNTVAMACSGLYAEGRAAATGAKP